MRATRRESYLSHLPHRFTSVSKAQLHQSDVDSDLLLDSDNVDNAIFQEQQVASVSLTEAAGKALIKLKHKQGTPLVEKHPHPGSTVSFCGPRGDEGISSSHRPLLPQPLCPHYKVLNRNSPDGGGSCLPA